jgi:hypothetical protein
MIEFPPVFVEPSCLPGVISRVCKSAQSEKEGGGGYEKKSQKLKFNYQDFADFPKAALHLAGSPRCAM